MMRFACGGDRDEPRRDMRATMAEKRAFATSIVTSVPVTSTAEFRCRGSNVVTNRAHHVIAARTTKLKARPRARGSLARTSVIFCQALHATTFCIPSVSEDPLENIAEHCEVPRVFGSE